MKKYLFILLILLSSCSSKNTIGEYRKNELLKVADRIELVVKEFENGELKKDAALSLMRQLSITIKVIILTCEQLEIMR